MSFHNIKSLVLQAAITLAAMFLPLPLLAGLDTGGMLGLVCSAAVATSMLVALFYGHAFVLEASQIVQFGRYNRGLLFPQLLAFGFHVSPIEAIKRAIPGQMESWAEYVVVAAIFAALRIAARLMIFVYAAAGAWVLAHHYPILPTLIRHVPVLADAIIAFAPLLCLLLPVLVGWILYKIVLPSKKVVTLGDVVREWNARLEAFGADATNSSMLLKFVILAVLSDENIETVKEIVRIKLEELRRPRRE